MALGPDGGAILQGSFGIEDAGFLFEASSFGFEWVDPPGLQRWENQSPLGPTAIPETFGTSPAVGAEGTLYLSNTDGPGVGARHQRRGRGHPLELPGRRVWRGLELARHRQRWDDLFHGRLWRPQRASISEGQETAPSSWRWPVALLPATEPRPVPRRPRAVAKAVFHPRAVRAAEPQPQDQEWGQYRRRHRPASQSQPALIRPERRSRDQQRHRRQSDIGDRPRPARAREALPEA